MKYDVTGTVTITYSFEVEADSIQEAQAKASTWLAEGAHELDETERDYEVIEVVWEEG